MKEKKLVVHFDTGDYINVEAEYIMPHNGKQIFAMNKDDEIVAIFELGRFYEMHFSEMELHGR